MELIKLNSSNFIAKNVFFLWTKQNSNKTTSNYQQFSKLKFISPAFLLSETDEDDDVEDDDDSAMLCCQFFFSKFPQELFINPSFSSESVWHLVEGTLFCSSYCPSIRSFFPSSKVLTSSWEVQSRFVSRNRVKLWFVLLEWNCLLWDTSCAHFNRCTTLIFYCALHISQTA